MGPWEAADHRLSGITCYDTLPSSARPLSAKNDDPFLSPLYPHSIPVFNPESFDLNVQLRQRTALAPTDTSTFAFETTTGMNVLEPSQERGYLSIGDHGLSVLVVVLLFGTSVLTHWFLCIRRIGNLRTAALVRPLFYSLLPVV